MDRGTTPAQVVVVHCRQVVVDERVGVDQFDGGRAVVQHFDRRTSQPSRGVDQSRPDALAAAEYGMAHGVRESWGNAGRL